MTQLTGLSGKRVLVTAGASGIGLSIAVSFAMAGAKVCVCDNDATAVAGLEDEHADLQACLTDVSQSGQVEDLFNEIKSRFGGLDILVNNAGISQPAVSLMDDDETRLDEMWAVNVKGPTRLTRFAMPYLAKSGSGRVVNVASLSGKRVKNDNMGYAMTKFAVVALTHATRRQGWDQGIRATAICPSFVRTDMTSDVNRVDPNEMIQPQDLAELIHTALTLPNNAVMAEMLVNYTLEDMF